MKSLSLPALPLFLAFSLSARANDWPQFRGPAANGHAKAEGLPTEWSETKNVKWKTPIPHKGWSTPLVSATQVWLTTATAEGNYFFVLCLNRVTGKVVWEHRVERGAKIETSPTAGDGKIYFQDMRAHVTILAAKDTPELIFSGSMADGEEKDVRSSIALANGCAFVRTTRMLYCVGGK